MDKAQPLRKRKQKCLCQSDHGPKRLCNREDLPVNDDEKMRDSGKFIDDSALDRNTWTKVVEKLDTDSLRRICLCSRWFAKEAARHLLPRVQIELSESGMARLINMSRIENFPSAVRTLVVRPTSGLPKLDFESWRDAVLEDEEGLATIDGVGVNLIKDTEKAECLYEEYNQERASLNATTVWSFMNELPYSLVCGKEGIQGQPIPLDRLSTAQRNYLEFNDALLKFTNLQSVETLDCRYFQWRDVLWGDETRDQDCPFDDRRVEHFTIAAVAFILRSLGLRSAFTSKLVSLSLSLQHDHTAYRYLKDIWKLRNIQNDGIKSLSTKMSLSDIQVKLMQDAFINLTTIDLNLTIGRAHERESFSILREQLKRAQNLEHLQLDILGFNEDPEDNMDNPIDALDVLTVGIQWSRLRELKLPDLHMTDESFIRTLSQATKTLETLHVHGCTLLGDGDSWPRLYQWMRALTFNALRDLHFFENTDIDAFETDFHVYDDRLVGNVQPDNEVWHQTIGQVHARKSYSTGIYDYILRRTNVRPPLKIVRGRF